MTPEEYDTLDRHMTRLQGSMENVVKQVDEMASKIDDLIVQQTETRTVVQGICKTCDARMKTINGIIGDVAAQEVAISKVSDRVSTITGIAKWALTGSGAVGLIVGAIEFFKYVLK